MSALVTTHAAEALVELYCRELKMPGLRAAHEGVARDATDRGHGFATYLAACLAEEIESRRQHRLATRLRQARFPDVKTLDGFDFAAIPKLSKPKVLSLAQGEFIREKMNVVCLGPSGTGKTHAAVGIGIAAIAAGYRVRFINAVTLSQELLAAQQEYRLPRYLASWRSVDLAIVDELGYLGLGPGGPVLFQFFADRYERGKSVLITSNLDFSSWVEVFNDTALTSALLDRLCHRAEILLFIGESYRFRQSRTRANTDGSDRT